MTKAECEGRRDTLIDNKVQNNVHSPKLFNFYENLFLEFYRIVDRVNEQSYPELSGPRYASSSILIGWRVLKTA